MSGADPDVCPGEVMVGCMGGREVDNGANKDGWDVPGTEYPGVDGTDGLVLTVCWATAPGSGIMEKMTQRRMFTCAQNFTNLFFPGTSAFSL